MERLTTNNPNNNIENLLNYAYAEKGRVKLQYGNGKEHIDLCEYIAAQGNKYCDLLTAETVMEGGCCDCDCEFAILYSVATQAAELRERLKHYEDLKEKGLLLKLPCKVGETVYIHRYSIHTKRDEVESGKVSAIKKDEKFLYITVLYDGWVSMLKAEKVFSTREEAEAALTEMTGKE